MTKRSLLAVAVFLGFLSQAGAQQMDHPLSFRSLYPSSAYSTSLARSDREMFPFSSGFARSVMTPNDFLPSWRPSGWENMTNLTLASTYPQTRQTKAVGSDSPYSKDSSKETVEMRKSLFDYVHGEVGFFYGRSSGGRNSMDSEGGYIFAETGNDKFSIGVGASYENSNYQFSRRGR